MLTNAKQRVVLALTAVVLILVVLFPPYTVHVPGFGVAATGYGYLFSLPPLKPASGYVFPATVNVSLLCTQLAVVLVAGFLVFLAFGGKESGPSDGTQTSARITTGVSSGGRDPQDDRAQRRVEQDAGTRRPPDGVSVRLPAIRLDSALIRAVRKGDAGRVKALLAAGADANTKTKDRITALMWAALNDHAGCVRALLAAGADPDVMRNGKTAIMLARTDVVKALLIAGPQKVAAVNVETSAPAAANPAQEFGGEPPRPVEQSDGAIRQSSGKVFVPTGRQVRPWVRYWARYIDVGIFCPLLGLFPMVVTRNVLRVLCPGMSPADRWNAALFFSIPLALFAYVFVEAGLLYWWGTTLGKALLNVRLRNHDGTRLNYRQALSRALSVYTRGMWLGIPGASAIANLLCLDDLSASGITHWDRAYGFRVEHRAVGFWRSAVAVGLVWTLAVAAKHSSRNEANGTDGTATTAALRPGGVGDLGKRETNDTALQAAALGGDVARVKELIAAGTDVDATNRDGVTALMAATQYGHVNCVRALLAAGANVDAKDTHGGTALMHGAYKGNADCIKALLAAGADVNAKNDLGETALMYTAFEGRASCVKVLLAGGADVTARDRDGKTALIHANTDEMRSLLRAAGAKR